MGAARSLSYHCWLSSNSRRDTYALLGISLPGRGDNCWGAGVHWSSGRSGRNRQAAVCDIPDPVPDFANCSPGPAWNSLIPYVGRSDRIVGSGHLSCSTRTRETELFCRSRLLVLHFEFVD